MAQSKLVPSSTPIDTFSIVHLANQEHAEVESQFVRRHEFYLTKTWRIIRNDKQHFNLKFNKNYDNPLLLNKGWEAFKKHWNLSENVEIVLDYFGHGLFSILAILDIKCVHDIPSFHSRSFKVGKTTFFDVLLTVHNFDYPKLHLKLEFAEFLLECGFNGFTLCGDNQVTMDIGVIHLGDTHRMKLGYNWDQFSNSQNFKPGDLIRFKFDIKDSPQVSKRCHVYQVQPESESLSSDCLIHSFPLH